MSDPKPDCLFCRIAAHQISAQIVYEDDRVLAFRDINPQAPVHLLVIPVQHIDSAHAVSAEHEGLWALLLRTAQRLAEQEGIAASGYRLVANHGRDGGQTVFHLHLHLLGGRQLGWPPG
jgi:histidine triad (HIT) family protein